MGELNGATTKAQLLAELKGEEANWEALLSEIGEDHMTQPDVAGGWSIKDIVAHLTGWRTRTVARLRAAARGAEPTPAPWPANLKGDDEINAWIYNASRDRSLADVLGESRAVFQHLLEAVEPFSDADLNSPTRFAWLDEADFPLTGALFFGHFHEEHEPDMRAWLAKIRAQ